MQFAETKTSAQYTSATPFISKKSDQQAESTAQREEDSFFGRQGIQPKLTVGQPGDKYEQEADQMADQVVQRLANPGSTPTLQAKCAACEEESVQTKGGASGTQISPGFQSQLNASKGGGQAMSPSLQTSMEGAFGADFSSVRLHTDNSAVQMNREIGARAFTNGSDVYFNEGQYSPGSSEGKRLLGHELTHVVQQEGQSSIEQENDDKITKLVQRRSESPNLIQAAWSTNDKATGFYDSWPANLYVAQKYPPDIIYNKYGDGFSPRVYWNMEYDKSVNLFGGDRGNYYINGQKHAGWDDEAEWTSLRSVQPAQLNQPAIGNYEGKSNTTSAEYTDTLYFSSTTVRAKAPIHVYRNHLAAEPKVQVVGRGIGYDLSNQIILPGVSVNPTDKIFNPTISQSESITINDSVTNSFGHTTKRSEEKDLGIKGGKEKGPDDDKFGFEGHFGVKWGEEEENSVSRAATNGNARTTSKGESMAIPITIPRGVPALVLIVPVTQKVIVSVEVRQSGEDGLISMGPLLPIKKVSHKNSPFGFTVVWGYDLEWVRKTKEQYEKARQLAVQAKRLRGRKLEAKKQEIRDLLSGEKIVADQNAALANARSIISGNTATSGVNQNLNKDVVDGVQVTRWVDGIDRIWKIADET